MHGQMNWGGHPHKRYSGAGMEMDVPLVPAPMVFFGMVAGLMIGMLIGHKKAMMHCGQPGMMGGMGHGRMGGMMGGMRGYGGDGDRMSRKKAMMQAMAAHHHHGYESAPCYCGCGGQSGETRQGAEDEERPGE